MIRDSSDREAIMVLSHAMNDVANDETVVFFLRQKAIYCLHHAIRHLAYPERDVYPKVRARKGDPVVRPR